MGSRMEGKGMKSFSKAVSRESHVRWLSHFGMKRSKTPEGNPPKLRKKRVFLLKASTVLKELVQAELGLS